MANITDNTVQILVKVDRFDGVEKTRKRVARFCWENFAPVGLVGLRDHEVQGSKFLDSGDDVIVISGTDNSGWTADALVERLGSGLLIGEVRRGDARIMGGMGRGDIFSE